MASKEYDWRKWMEAIQQDGRNLTVWEEEFIGTIEGKFARPTVTLSEKQAEILERIYTDRVP